MPFDLPTLKGKTVNDEMHPGFTDKRNITVGQARVIWAKASGHLPEGYVVPGGRRITNAVQAHEYAIRLNDYMQGKAPSRAGLLLVDGIPIAVVRDMQIKVRGNEK